MLPDRARRGVFPPETRAQATALACSLPRVNGVPLGRWSSGSIARRLVELGETVSICSSTVRRWLRAEKLKPWRFRLWQHITDPQAFMQRARPVLELYQEAKQLLRQGVWLVCGDEKSSIQARRGEQPRQPSVPEHLATTSPRYERGGAVQLFGALSVADGKVLGQCRARKCFSDFCDFVREVIVPEAIRREVKKVILILDNGPTHAPKQLENWLRQLVIEAELDFEIHVQWLPVCASWLDQIEIWFSRLQSQLLRPNDFENCEALIQSILDFIDYYNEQAQPIKWTYTVDKLADKLAHKLGTHL